jgi:hypothetical protein
MQLYYMSYLEGSADRAFGDLGEVPIGLLGIWGVPMVYDRTWVTSRIIPSPTGLIYQAHPNVIFGTSPKNRLTSPNCCIAYSPQTPCGIDFGNSTLNLFRQIRRRI